MKIDIHKFFLVIVSFSLLAGCKENAKANSPEIQDGGRPCGQVMFCISAIRTILLRKAIEKKGHDKINLAELKEYDLNSPDFDGQIQKVLPLIEDISDNGKFILTASNRINNTGTDAPELLAFITDLKPEICKSVTRTARGIRQTNVEIEIPTSDVPNLLLFSQTNSEKDIVTLPQNPSDIGCIEAEGRYYYYQIIYAF